MRDIIRLIYAFAILHGEKVANPNTLSPDEIRIVFEMLEKAAAGILPTSTHPSHL